MRYFLSALGTSVYKESVYRLDGVPYRSSFAPAAIAALAHLHGATGLILLTEDARANNWAALEHELNKLGLDCKPLKIPECLTREDVFALLDTLAEEIPPESSVFLDITFGLRHLPVVYYAALTFAAGLKKVSVENIYYAPWELRSGDDVEVFDITVTFRLLEWFHALRSFRDSGDSRPLSGMLDSDISQLFRLGQGDTTLGKARDALRALSANLAAGLPLQAGVTASRLNAAFSNLAQVGSGESPSRLAAEMINDATHEISAEATKATDIELNQAELARQLRVARWYATRGDLGQCFAILREWMVNARLLASGKTTYWLPYRVRAPAERFFTSMRHRSMTIPLDEPQRCAASLWDKISEHRNFLQHCGMKDREAISDTTGRRSMPGEGERTAGGWLRWLKDAPQRCSSFAHAIRQLPGNHLHRD
jgi:CRISPR-associated DxTHG motif protein